MRETLAVIAHWSNVIRDGFKAAAGGILVRRLPVIGIGSGRPVRIGRAGPELGANYDARELTADRVDYLRGTPTGCCSGLRRASNRCATPEVSAGEPASLAPQPRSSS